MFVANRIATHNIEWNKEPHNAQDQKALYNAAGTSRLWDNDH